MPLNSERVMLLADALRSGEYKQGSGALHRIRMLPDGTREDTWCCLGVAGDVAARNGCRVARDIRVPGESSVEFIGDSDGFLDPAVRDWYGFGCINPVITVRGKPVTATLANDILKADLEEIGNAFEQLARENDG